MQRPQAGEYGPYFQRYIDLVPDEPITDFLQRQLKQATDFLRSIPEERGEYRYAPGKWSIKEVIGHAADTERIMSYRLLCIARGETLSLPGFDQDLYIQGAGFDNRSLQQLVEDLTIVRQSTLSLLAGLTEEALGRTGTANNNAVSVRALAYIIAGHTLHHLKMIEQKYLGNA